MQEKLESAQREAQVLEIKRQGQLKALEAQRAKKEVRAIELPPLPIAWLVDSFFRPATALLPPFYHPINECRLVLLIVCLLTAVKEGSSYEF